jgi:hypothetical protein
MPNKNKDEAMNGRDLELRSHRELYEHARCESHKKNYKI